MPQWMVIRPVHFLPGKREEALRWARETEELRRQWGLLWQVNVRSAVDPNEHLFLQMWESKDAYERWKSSPDRARLMAEANRLVLQDRTRTYEVL